MRSDKGSAGVIFTLDTESGFRDVVLVNTSYGPKAITVGLGMIITETPLHRSVSHPFNERLSLNPDVAIRTALVIAAAEAKKRGAIAATT